MKVVYYIFGLMTLIIVTKSEVWGNNLRKNSVIITATISATSVSCYGGNNGTAIVTATGGTTYTYRWSNGQTTQKASNLTAGSYNVTVTSGAQKVTATTTITQPKPLLGSITPPTSITCVSPTVKITAGASGGTAPYAFRWSTNETTDNIIASQPNNYFVSISDRNGCTTTAITLVSQVAPMVGTITKSAPVTCATINKIKLSASANGGTLPYTYLWSTNETTPIITPNTEGVYSVTITDSKNCKTVAKTVVSCLPTTLLTAGAIVTNTSCYNSNNGSIKATATGGTGTYTFRWSNGQMTQTATNLGKGTFTVTVSSGIQTATASAFVDETTQLIGIILPPTTITCGNPSSILTAGVRGGTMPYTYKWSTNAANTSIEIKTAGDYSVTITDAKNCKATASTTVTGRCVPAQLAIPNTILIEKKIVNLFPNPAIDEVNMNLVGFEGQKVSLHFFNQLGQLVKTQVVQEASQQPVVVDLADFTEGVYMVNIISNRIRVVQKLKVSKHN